VRSGRRCRRAAAKRRPRVHVECGSAHLRRISATGCEIGLEFREFRDDGAARLEEFCLQLGAAFAHPEADP